MCTEAWHYSEVCTEEAWHYSETDSRSEQKTFSGSDPAPMERRGPGCLIGSGEEGGVGRGKGGCGVVGE